MHKLRTTYGSFARIICILFAVHLFNFSIDPRDRNPDSIPEDLSINEIESVTEFLAEVLFNFEDAFAEHDEADSEDGGTLDLSKVFITKHGEGYFAAAKFIQLKDKYVVRNSTDFEPLVRDINAPPPKG